MNSAPATVGTSARGLRASLKRSPAPPPEPRSRRTTPRQYRAGQGRRRALWTALLTGLLVATPWARAELPMPPQLGPLAQADFARYREAMPDKAFVIGPGGAWGWQSGATSAAAAEAAALATCNEQAAIACRPYARDDRIVFDPTDWAQAWRPYPSAAEAARRPLGLMRGARFPDLEFTDAAGTRRTLAALRGKAVILHFWGSWCGPCRHELPDMAAFVNTLDRATIAVVPLQVREDIATARAWLARERIALPVYDSGMRSPDDGSFRIAGGGQLPDRAVAPVFPSTVFLDRHGLIVFAHHGPIERWADYRPQLADLVAATAAAPPR